MTRSDRKAGNSKILRKVLSTLLILCMAIGYLPAASVFAEAGQPPTNSKVRTDNNDGTYTLALTVRGDSEDEITQVANVNVLLVYDISQSMQTDIYQEDPKGTYGKVGSAFERLYYRRNNGEFREIDYGSTQSSLYYNAGGGFSGKAG